MERKSPCKVNLILNILGKRPDGYHELETVMHHVPVHDLLAFKKKGSGIVLTCNEPTLPVDGKNLVYRAAQKFFEATGIESGIEIHLEKRVPMAAGLGGGSSNAAHTLSSLNEIFGNPLDASQLHTLAASMGSDIPFFLQDQPALATGRGEAVNSLAPFKSLENTFIFLVHPGFGISTPWAYQELAKHPQALNGRKGRCEELVRILREKSLSDAAPLFYNSLEAPALRKYPLLQLYQDYMKQNGATVALMSGSGSTTFALFEGESAAREFEPKFKDHFGDQCWTAVVKLRE